MKSSAGHLLLEGLFHLNSGVIALLYGSFR